MGVANYAGDSGRNRKSCMPPTGTATLYAAWLGSQALPIILSGIMGYLIIAAWFSVSQVVDTLSWYVDKLFTWATWLSIGTICVHAWQAISPLAAILCPLLYAHPATAAIGPVAAVASVTGPLSLDKVVLSTLGALLSFWTCCSTGNNH